MKVVEITIEESKYNIGCFVLVAKTECGKTFVLTGNSGNAYLQPYDKSCDIQGDGKI